MENRFIIIIGSYNNSQWVEDNVGSILAQDYTNWKVIYCDDASTDDTWEQMKKFQGDPRFHLIHNEKRKLKTGFFLTLDWYDGYPITDRDILVFLDGDDMLASENVLSYLNAVYNQTHCWMTYGGMRVWEGGDNIVEPFPQNSEIPSQVINTKAYRKDTWRTSHLKSMRGFLWKRFDKADFFHEGEHIVGPDDLAIMFAMLEMTPPERVYRVEEPLYIYNHSQANQQSRAFTDHKNKGIDYEGIVRSRTPYDTLSFVTPTLAGGLGNQMFEIAAAASLAKDNNAVLILNNEEHILPNQGRNVNNYLDNLFSRLMYDPTIKPQNYYKWDPCVYKPIPFAPNIKIVGHFQSYRYFDHNRKYIQSLFRPPENRTAIGEGVTAIQVRRGDYYKFPQHHPLLPIEYYTKAVELVAESTKHICIFSDDHHWCKENLKFDFPTSYGLDSTGNRLDYIEMAEMMQCQNLIISNSSFGWWAAYLNMYPYSNIVVPSIWFGQALVDEGFKIDNLVLPEWNKVQL